MPYINDRHSSGDSSDRDRRYDGPDAIDPFDEQPQGYEPRPRRESGPNTQNGHRQPEPRRQDDARHRTQVHHQDDARHRTQGHHQDDVRHRTQGHRQNDRSQNDGREQLRLRNMDDHRPLTPNRYKFACYYDPSSEAAHTNLINSGSSDNSRSDRRSGGDRYHDDRRSNTQASESASQKQLEYLRAVQKGEAGISDFHKDRAGRARDEIDRYFRQQGPPTPDNERDVI